MAWRGSMRSAHPQPPRRASPSTHGWFGSRWWHIPMRSRCRPGSPIQPRPLPAEAAIGGPLRIGLLWRATRDAPDALQFKVRLVRANGEVAQETVLPLLGGRLQPSALHTGNVVRDEQSVLVAGNVPGEP